MSVAFDENVKGCIIAVNNRKIHYYDSIEF